MTIYKMERLLQGVRWLVVVVVVTVVVTCAVFITNHHQDSFRLPQLPRQEKASGWRAYMCTKDNDTPTYMDDYRLPLAVMAPSRRDLNVFLIDTACNPHPKFRAYCAVESWARHNPARDVWYLLTTLRTQDSDRLPSLLQQRYPNLRLATLELDSLFKDTPLHPLFTSHRWAHKKSFPVEMLADMVRVLALWHWGGVYADTDMVCLRPFSVAPNAVGWSTNAALGNALLAFTAHHPTLWKLMQYMNNSFKVGSWTSIGPEAITKVVAGACGGDSAGGVQAKAPTTCGGVTLYPASYFFPVPYYNHALLTKAGGGADFEKRFQAAHVVHFFNKLTKGAVVRAGSGSVYEVAAKANCPLTYRLATMRSDTF